jgi:hypothetical protein
LIFFFLTSTPCLLFQLLVLPSTPCLLFNFFSMVLIWENFYAIMLDGVVKILRRILGKMGLIVLYLGKDRGWIFLLSHGRVEWSLGLRIINTICIVEQKKIK